MKLWRGMALDFGSTQTLALTVGQLKAEINTIAALSRPTSSALFLKRAEGYMCNQVTIHLFFTNNSNKEDDIPQ